MIITGKPYKYIGLFIALLLPVVLPLFRISFGPNPIVSALIKEGFMWLLFVLLLAVAKYGEKEPMLFSGNGMGLFKTIGCSILIVFSLVLTGIVFRLFCTFILKTHPPHEDLMDKFMKYPLWLKLLITIRAGVVEETFFRAYGISRIRQLTNNGFLALAVPLLIFALGHYAYGTISHVAGAFFLGVVLSLYYLKTKNLLSNIIGHTLYDSLSLISFQV